MRLPAGRSPGCPRGTCPHSRPFRVLFPFPHGQHQTPVISSASGGPNKTAGSSCKKDHLGCPSGSDGMGLWKSGCRNDGAQCLGYLGLPRRQSSTRPRPDPPPSWELRNPASSAHLHGSPRNPDTSTSYHLPLDHPAARRVLLLPAQALLRLHFAQNKVNNPPLSCRDLP